MTDVSSPTPEYVAAALTSFWAKLIAHDSTLVDCSIANQETVKAAVAFFKAFSLYIDSESDVVDLEEVKAAGVMTATSIVGAINQCEVADPAEVRTFGRWIYKKAGNKSLAWDSFVANCYDNPYVEDALD